MRAAHAPPLLARPLPISQIRRPPPPLLLLWPSPVKNSKVLGTFRLQPCGSPWTRKMTLAADLVLLQRWEFVLTFLNTGGTSFPVVHVLIPCECPRTLYYYLIRPPLLGQ
jgi:hypothetical protein